MKLKPFANEDFEAQRPHHFPTARKPGEEDNPMRTREELQSAHDLLERMLSNEILQDGITIQIQSAQIASLAVLCWALGHPNEHLFAQILDGGARFFELFELLTSETREIICPQCQRALRIDWGKTEEPQKESN